MSISGIVTRSFGSWGSVVGVVTRGVGIGAAIAVSPDGAVKLVTTMHRSANIAHGSRAIKIINDPRAPKMVKK